MNPCCKEEVKGINSKQFVRLAKKFGVKVNQEKIKKLENGTFLCKRVNEDTGKITIYILNEIYFKKYYKKYSASHKSKGVKEMLISNFELPRGPVLNIKN